MRGGVSLAVWIGGAVAEIDLFRRACHQAAKRETNLIAAGENDRREERAKKYVELLRATKYNDVEVDILAGASAGGLNAVLFGLAQSCGTVLDEPVRRTWIECGGIWDLLRDRGALRVPSILKGDERLFTVARDALKIIADPSKADAGKRPLVHKGTRARQLWVELAATLLDDPHNPERGNRASFSFSKTPGDLGSHYTTIPSADDDLSSPLVEEAISRMALAARSTSSFPGAFEPATIYSSPDRDETFAQTLTAKLPKRRRKQRNENLFANMSRAFLYARRTESAAEPFNVVDGGIFDNIPIDRAIRAIRRAPASQPSERWLIYLDPEPPASPDPSAEPVKTSSAASWIPVIRSSMALQQRTETASDELRLLHDNNQSALAARARLEALGALLKDLGSSAQRMASVDEALSDSSYIEGRIATDTGRISALLSEPWSELCQPPRGAVDYAGLAPEKALSLKDWVAAAYKDMGAEELSKDVYAKLDCLRILMPWIHALERLLEGLAMDSPADPAHQKTMSEQLARCKRRTYRCLTTLVEAKRLTTDLSLAEPLRDNPAAGRMYKLDDIPSRLRLGRSLQRSLTMPEKLAQHFAAESADEKAFYTDLADWSESRYGVHRRIVAQLETDQPGAGDFEEVLNRELDRLLDDVLEASQTVVANMGDHSSRRWWRQWNGSVFAHLYEPPLVNFSLARLSRLFTTAGIPDNASVISFDQITGDERPHFNVEKLEDAAMAKQLRTWLSSLSKEEPMRRVLETAPRKLVVADAKLAGNVIARFGGFFRARWRENDWQWGRLDAAAGIVRILNRARPRPLSDEHLEEDIAALQVSIAYEARESVAVPEEFAGQSDSSIVETVGGEGLDTLSPHYRFALASRVVPLVYRALMPPKDARLSVGGIATGIGQVIVRPLAVPLTLIADPLRLVLALAVVLLSASFLGAARSQVGWQFIFLAVYLAAGILIAVRARSAHKKWESLNKQIAKVSEGLNIQRWEEIREGAFRASRKYIFGGYALAVITWVWAAHHLCYVISDLRTHTYPRIAMPFESMLATTALIIVLQHWLNKRAYQVGVPAETARKSLFDSVITHLKRYQLRRVLVVVAVILGLCVLRISNVIANYQSAVLANCNLISADRNPHCDSKGRRPSALVALGVMAKRAEYFFQAATFRTGGGINRLRRGSLLPRLSRCSP